MTEADNSRLLAWSRELRQVHERLRSALRVVQESLDDDEAVRRAPTRELLLYCRGFCTALDRHHRGEDRHLFPAIAEQHPELRDSLRNLSQDHSMISHLLGGLEDAVDRAASTAELHRHLEGLAAVMESHFRYEERTLLLVLETLHLEADPQVVLGPL